jgi:hypothetical protein
MSEITLKVDGEDRIIENGLMNISDLIEYAKDTLTDFGNKDIEETIEIDLLDFFDSLNNDDYLITDDTGEYYILVGNMPYTAYNKNKVIENRNQVFEPRR